jgi:hypothetical protein
MSFVGDFLGDTVGGITGAKQAGEAAEDAGQRQSEMYGRGIEVNQAQFDKLVELMAPFVSAGTGAIGGQQALLGLSGADAQRSAIAGLESSPQMQALIQQGENSLLQNASATGGLRGGNIQAALAQFRPQVLSSMIESQFNKLGGISQMGQAAAAGQASAGMNFGGTIADLLGQQGAAQAGGIMGKGGIVRQTFGDLLSIAQLGTKAKSAGMF